MLQIVGDPRVQKELQSAAVVFAGGLHGHEHVVGGQELRGLRRGAARRRTPVGSPFSAQLPEVVRENGAARRSSLLRRPLRARDGERAGREQAEDGDAEELRPSLPPPRGPPHGACVEVGAACFIWVGTEPRVATAAVVCLSGGIDEVSAGGV